MTVGVEELTLSSLLQLAAMLELLEEAGILTQKNVLERMKEIRDRKKPKSGEAHPP